MIALGAFTVWGLVRFKQVRVQEDPQNNVDWTKVTEYLRSQIVQDGQKENPKFFGRRVSWILETKGALSIEMRNTAGKLMHNIQL